MKIKNKYQYSTLIFLLQFDESPVVDSNVNEERLYVIQEKLCKSFIISEKSR